MKLTHSLLLAAAMGLSLAACDNIDKDNRYLPMPEKPTPEDPSVPVRRVLLEEFTGQRCVNCPAAHELVEGMVEDYGTSLIPVSIHGGSFAIKKGNAKLVALGNDEADAIVNSYGATRFPAAVVNGKNGSGLMEVTSTWRSAVSSQLNAMPLTGITITPAYDAASGNITVDVEVENLTSSAYNGELHIWVVENDITAFQLDANGKAMQDYVHNHVFRAWFTGLNGLGFSAGTDGGKFATQQTIACNPDWKPENLHIVAFTRSGGYVGNANIAPLIPSEEEPAEEQPAEEQPAPAE